MSEPGQCFTITRPEGEQNNLTMVFHEPDPYGWNFSNLKNFYLNPEDKTPLNEQKDTLKGLTVEHIKRLCEGMKLFDCFQERLSNPEDLHVLTSTPDQKEFLRHLLHINDNTADVTDAPPAESFGVKNIVYVAVTGVASALFTGICVGITCLKVGIRIGMRRVAPTAMSTITHGRPGNDGSEYDLPQPEAPQSDIPPSQTFRVTGRTPQPHLPSNPPPPSYPGTPEGGVPRSDSYGNVFSRAPSSGISPSASAVGSGQGLMPRFPVGSLGSITREVNLPPSPTIHATVHATPQLTEAILSTHAGYQGSQTVEFVPIPSGQSSVSYTHGLSQQPPSYPYHSGGQVQSQLMLLQPIHSQVMQVNPVHPQVIHVLPAHPHLQHLNQQPAYMPSPHDEESPDMPISLPATEQNSPMPDHRLYKNQGVEGVSSETPV